MKQFCLFGELKVFWFGWSTGVCKQCWVKRMERCVGLEYEDFVCFVKEVGRDVVRLINVVIDMLYNNYYVILVVCSIYYVYVWDCWLGGFCCYRLGLLLWLGIGWMLV